MKYSGKSPWWRHQMEIFSALIALCAFPAQRPLTRSIDVFFNLRLNTGLSEQIETLVIWNAIALIMTSQ